MRRHRHVLATGQNTVGRGSENDITLGTEFRDVSRRHLIAEPIDDHIILLTDISSHGTFAPPLQFELKESLNKAWSKHVLAKMPR